MTCHITSSMYKTCPSMHVNEITGVAMILCNYRLWTKKRIIGHAKLTDFSYFPWNCRDSRSWIEWSRVISCYSARDKVTTRTRRIRGRHSCVKRNLIELRLTATVSTPTQNMGYLLKRFVISHIHEAIGERERILLFSLNSGTSPWLLARDLGFTVWQT